MAEEIRFCRSGKKSFKALPLQALALDPQLQHIKAEGGAVDIELYKADKFEKIVLCTIKIYEISMVEATVLAWPDDKHNFPVLWCNLTHSPLGYKCSHL